MESSRFSLLPALFVLILFFAPGGFCSPPDRPSSSAEKEARNKLLRLSTEMQRELSGQPDDYWMHWRLSAYMRLLRRTPELTKFYQGLCTRYPGNDILKFFLARTLPLSGQEALLKKLSSPWRPLGLGFLRAKAGDSESALAFFHETVKTSPGFALGYAVLARELQSQGDHGHALACARKAVGLDNNHSWILYQYGWILYCDLAGRRTQAIEALSRALKLNNGWLGQFSAVMMCRCVLAQTLATNNDGVFLGPGAELDKSLEQLRLCLKISGFASSLPMSVQIRSALILNFAASYQETIDLLSPARICDRRLARVLETSRAALELTSPSLSITVNNGIARFECRRPPCSGGRLWILGSFNGWQRRRDFFRENDGGVLSYETRLRPGTYTYMIADENRELKTYSLANATAFSGDGLPCFTVTPDGGLEAGHGDHLDSLLFRAALLDAFALPLLDNLCMRALRIDPRSSEALELLARNYADFGREKLVLSRFTGEQRLFVQAWLAVLGKNFDLARDIVSRIKSPFDGVSWYSLQALTASCARRKADSLIKGIVYGKRTGGLFKLFADLDNLDKAVVQLRRSLKGCTSAAILSSASRMSALAGDMDGAIEILAPLADPDPSAYQHALIEVYKISVGQGEKHIEKAIHQARNAFESFPYRRDFARYYMNLLDRCDNLSKERAFLEKLLSANADSPGIVMALARLNALEDKYDAARRNYEKAAGLAPQWFEARFLAGLYFESIKSFRKAKFHLEAAAGILPAKGAAVLALGRVYDHCGESDKKALRLREALPAVSQKRYRGAICAELADYYTWSNPDPGRAFEYSTMAADLAAGQPYLRRRLPLIGTCLLLSALRLKNREKAARGLSLMMSSPIFLGLMVFFILFPFILIVAAALFVRFVLPDIPALAAIRQTAQLWFIVFSLQISSAVLLGLLLFDNPLEFFDCATAGAALLVYSSVWFSSFAMLALSVIFLNRVTGWEGLNLGLKDAAGMIIPGSILGLLFACATNFIDLVLCSLHSPTGLTSLFYGAQNPKGLTALLHSRPGLLFFILTSMLIVPTAEEFFFRGFLFRRLKTDLPPLLAAIISSALFALVHMQSMLLLFLFGLGQAYLLEKYESLWICIYSHAAWNGFVIGLILLS